MKVINLKYINNKGLSLIEIIISISILGIIIISVIPLFGDSLFHIISSSKKNEAMSIATNKMEQLYSIQPLNKPLNTNNIETQLSNNYTVELDSEDEDYIFNIINDTDKIIGEIIIDNHIDGNHGYKVTINIYYNMENKQITLTSFVRSN